MRRHGSARMPCPPTIPSCSIGKVRFLVINDLNDYRICMCLIMCIREFRDEILSRGGGGKNLKPGKNVFFKKRANR